MRLPRYSTNMFVLVPSIILPSGETYLGFRKEEAAPGKTYERAPTQSQPTLQEVSEHAGDRLAQSVQHVRDPSRLLLTILW